MPITAHVYQIYIAADAPTVWAAITDSDWTERYFHTTRFVEPPVAGAAYRTVKADGGDAIEGVVEEMQPPAGDRPGRFVQTWHVLYDAAMAAEPPGRVEWTVEAVGDGLTRVRLVHGDLARSPITWANVKDGWVWILDAMKTVVETGRPLPPPDVDPGDEEVRSSDWHRAQGVEATNAAFDLLARDARGPRQDEDLLEAAYTAAFHWARAASATPANRARADYLIAKALLATGQPERALLSAEACLAGCRDHDLTDFDLAYAHEAIARTLHALGRREEAVAAWLLATAVPVADPEDREIVEADFADVPALLAV